MRIRKRSLQWACRPVVDFLERRRLLSLSVPTEQTIDFGDAPNSYQTLLISNGANHLIVPMLFMGQFIDAEPDGQPSPNADLDDNSPAGMPDDEDGVTFLTPLTPGAAYTVQVVNGGSMPGFVDAWIDINNNGTFNDPVDQILAAAPAAPGVNTYNLVLAPNAVFGPTYARFRLSNFGGLPPFGPGGDGEVEDYRVFIEDVGPAVDFGDAPNSYQTLLASNGPSHPITLPAVVLGNVVDGEQDGQPSPNADLDDLTGPIDDEDGIALLNPIVPGGNLQVQVTNGGTGINFISGWIDFNINGNFLDATDVLFIGAPVPPGVTVIPVPVPANAQPGPTYARFRLSTQPVPQPFGPAPNGEVEDYRVTIEPEVQPSDFGDAPNTYQTLLASNGPRHPLVAPIFFGATVDPEQDGQPSPNADLDDLTGVPDDEDGITLLTPIVPGGNTQVQVILGGAGVVPAPMSAWMDFNIDGDFLDAGEQIFTNQLLNPGPNVLTFVVPANAAVGPTFSRWRVSTVGNLAPFGLAPDGEVEDYRNRIDEPVEPLDFGDAPNISLFGTAFPTLLAENGARHASAPIMPILGNLWDAEPDGQPHAQALGDDLSLALPDDEDGVLINGLPADVAQLLGGQTNQLQVFLSFIGGPTPAILSAWFDLNQDLDWNDPGEQLLVNVPLNPGNNAFQFFVPPSMGGRMVSRFRVSTVGGLAYTGAAPDGEVEDYSTQVIPDTTPPGVNLAAFEWDSRQAVTLIFTEPLDPLTVAAGDLAALNLTDGTTPVAAGVALGGNNTSATWVFNTPGVFVSDGNYRFTLSAGMVADPSGNPNLAYTLQGPSIYYFGGDANRDRTVGIADFAILAANFNLPGTFSKGDFDYTGVVGIGDFAILASKFNTSLPGSLPGDAATALPARPMFGSQRIRDDVFAENSELPW